MIITAGQEAIQALGIIEGQGGVQGVMCDTVQITLPAIPTQEQLAALMAGAITDDGRSLQGYDGLTEVRLTLYRTPQDARDRAMQEMTAEVERRAEAERQAREAEAAAQAEREAALQAQAEAEQQREQAQEQVKAKSAQLLAVAEALPDELAAQHADLYPQLSGDGQAVPAGKRINWRGQIAKANVTLWDREDQDPDRAPELWTILTIQQGYRVIPNPIPATETFQPGEIGLWEDGKLYKSIHPTPHAWTPAEYAQAWELYTP